MLNHRSNRYLDNISQFDVNILHCKGKNNPADALSRLHYANSQLFAFHANPVMATDVPSVGCTVPTSFIKQFEAAYHVDPATKETYTGSGFMYVGESTCPILYVPDSTSLDYSITLRAALLRECHESPLAAHPGIKRMLALMKRRYFWPGMYSDICNYVNTCDLCKINKSANSKPWGLLQPLPVPLGRWSDISIDFIGHLPVAQDTGNDCVLVIVDRLTKLVRFIPCKSTITAEEAAKLFIKYVFKDFGLAKTMLSDRDSLFISKFWQTLFKQLGTILPMSCGYHPKTDGQTEVMNKTLEGMLRPYVGAPHRQQLWEEYLPLVEFAYNSTPQTSTGKSPFELMYGFQPRAPVDLVTELNGDSSDFLQDLYANLLEAHCNLLNAQRSMKHFYDRGHLHRGFEIGDEVFVSFDALPPSRRDSKLSPLFHPQPFKIIEKIGNVSYRLKIPNGWRNHNVFHVSQLKPRSSKSRNISKEPLSVVDMVRKYGQDLCLVHWSNSTSHEDSWVPASFISDEYPDLIAEFTGTQYISNPTFQSRFLDALDDHKRRSPKPTKRLGRKSKSIK